MCVECQSFLVAKHQKENAHKHRESVKRYLDNGGKKLRSEWYQRNKDRLRESRRDWNLNNPGKRAAYNSKRRALIFMAMPKWANQDELSKFYSDAKKISAETGIQHEVDHIIPLKHHLVCGLHVPANLQILTASENSRKHNSFADEGTENTLRLKSAVEWAAQ
jgi:5-methylcytosine-specific restriction endonuclease McrA